MLGDSGYSARSWLLTPVLRREITPGARRYLRRLKATRQLIECALGAFKEKFPCMNHLRLKSPESCAKLILMCVTVYNIENMFAHNNNECIEINIDNNDNDAFQLQDDNAINEVADVNAVRVMNEIIDLFENE